MSIEFRKTAASAGNGARVEVAVCDHEILVRNSKDPDGPCLRYDWDEWLSFLAGAKAGEFDDI